MSADNSSTSPNHTSTANPNDMARQQRRGSVSSAALSSLFRSNSISQAQNGVTPFPGPLTTAALNDQRRRLSITTLGLSGTSPSASTSFMRRASMSTNSDSIDESAIDEDDAARTAPTTPFTRRMSFGANQAMRGVRGGTSPGNEQGFNWSEQLRSRAESTVAHGGPRASFSFATGLAASPPRPSVTSASAGPPPVSHDRAKSVSDMPAPPAQPPRARPQKPDPFQERILKGDFYMD